MPEHFTILSRKDRAPVLDEYDTVVGLKTKNFDEPLCGFSNYTEDIPIGTVVGVQIQSNEMSQAKYKASLTHGMEIFKEGIKITSAENDENENSIFCPEKIFEYQEIFEYFFKITGFDPDNLTYSIEPVFLHKDQIIRKSIREHCYEDVPMKADFYTDKSFVVENYVEYLKSIGKPTRMLESFCFSEYRADELKKLIDSDGTVGRNELKKKLIEKGLPFKGNNRNVIFSKSKQESGCLKQFYSLLDEHRNFFESILGPDGVANLGSEHLLVENFEKIYNEAVSARNGISTVSITYDLYISEALVPASIDVTELKSIKRSDIFRVYLDDPLYTIVPSNRLTDWHFVSISPAIIGYLQPGNIVRVLIGSEECDGVVSKDYVVLLDRIDSESFFAAHFDMYSNTDENILIVVHISGIIEIPLDWDMNENLELAAASLSPPEQPCDDDGEPISILQHALTYAFRSKGLDHDPNVYYSITYDDMTWESQDNSI